MAKQIPLTQGKVAWVDDEDYDWAMQWTWYAVRNGGNWYAVRTTTGPNRKIVSLHREIMNAPDGVRVDHEDRDGLNDRKGNLRPATHAQNMQNSGPQTNNTSGFKGVTWNKWAGKWKAKIMVNSKNIHLGYFDDPAEAALAYDEAAKKYHKDFAYANFPQGDEANGI